MKSFLIILILLIPTITATSQDSILIEHILDSILLDSLIKEEKRVQVEPWPRDKKVIVNHIKNDQFILAMKYYLRMVNGDYKISQAYIDSLKSALGK